MFRTRTRRAAVRAWLPLALCLALPAPASAHDTGAHHHHGRVTHGDPDKALPDTLITQAVAQEEFTSVEPASVVDGTAPETWCGTARTDNYVGANQVVATDTPHYKLVYAYASDQANRFDDLKDQLQGNVSLLQRYLATQSDSRKALRWDMGTDCGTQYVDVQIVQLPEPRAQYIPGGVPDFYATRDDVYAAIGGGAPRNVAIYADALRTNSIAGQGELYGVDETTTNVHDRGGNTAIVWGPQTLPTGAYAEPSVLMHEIGHNIGAVQNSAPNSTLASHCFDEWDVMCYADGGTNGGWDDLVTNCDGLSGGMTETFDCGRDDYFHPFPADGSYLDRKWNTYAVAHLGPCSSELADSCGLTGTAPDGTKPANTTPVPADDQWLAGWSTTLSGTDTESGIDAYQWKYADWGDPLPDAAATQEASITGEHAGWVAFYTRIRDAAGNWSTWREDLVSIDSAAPVATVDCPEDWSTTTAPTCSYTVTDAGVSFLSSLETPSGTTSFVAAPASGTVEATSDAQEIRVRGTDWLDNVGDWGSDTARWDRVNPTVDVTCPAEWSTGSTTCHVDASDAESGIDTVTWQVGDGTPTEVEPNSDFAVTDAGENTITVVATDVAGRTSQDTATSRVTEVTAPTGSDNAVTTEEDTTHTFAAGEFGFSDPNGDTFASVRVDELPAAGTLRSSGVAVVAGATHAPASLTFSPAADGCGTSHASFTFSVRDSTGEYDTSPNTMTLHVTCVDDPPVAADDSTDLNEDAGGTTVDVLTNDTDVDGGDKLVTGTTNGANGTVAITNDGEDLTYTPDANHCGGDSFSYSLNGGSTATVSVSVACIDDMPVAGNDGRTVDEDAAPTALDVRTNDTDVDGGTKLVTGTTTPLHGTVAVIDGGSDVTYTPTADYCGADSFTYTLNGGSTATVSVTVSCLDDAPIAVNDTKTLGEDAPASAIDVLTNDTDVDGGDSVIESKSDGAHGTVAITNDGADVTYSPAADYCGPDSFTYTLNGGSAATVNVTVTCVDDAPVAVDDTATVLENDPATTIDVLDNDTDIDAGPKAITSNGVAAHGAVAITNDGADLAYTPAADYCGSDSFTYTITGGTTATVSITVTCTDDLPVAVNDSRTVAEDSGATTIDVRANDTDADGGTKTIESTTDGAHGSVAITNGGVDLTYTPAADYCGTDSFTYTLNGGSTATVDVTVTCVDDPPAAVNDSEALDEDSGATTFDVLANDTDVDEGPSTIVATTGADHGAVSIAIGADTVIYTPDADYCGTDAFTYTLNGGSTATVSLTVTCVDDPPVALNDVAMLAEDAGATAIDVLANDTDVDGGDSAIESKTNGDHGIVAVTGAGAGLTYTPDADFCGPDSFTYTLNGGSTATVTLAVTCAEQPPVAVNDSETVTEDAGATTLDVLGNDTDADGGMKKLESTTSADHGAVAITNDGAGLTYKPAPNYCGRDSFTYTLNGGSTATVTITVTCVDDAPVAVNDSRPVAEDSGPTIFDVRANDTDRDGGPKTITAKADGAHGSVAITNDGTDLTYKPAADYCGRDSFTYALNGGSRATVDVTVTCVDDAPVAVDDAAVLAEDTWVLVDVRANDTDVDGGPKAIASKTDGAHGATAITVDGKVAYKPGAGYCGADSFTYTLNGGSTATVGVFVACVREAAAAGDTQSPETSLKRGPKKKVKTRKRKAKVVFKLEASEPGTTFLCKLDKGEFKACGPKKAYKVKPGRHVFRAVAVDAAGNSDATPMTKKFKVVRIKRR